MAILAASRAANTGLDTVIATSSDPSDDCLAATAEAAGVPVVRGPLADVLQRFVLASEGFASDDTIIRLTADNVLVDGTLLSELASAFTDNACSYMTTSDPASGLPYGVSAEIFSVGALRQADTPEATEFDREHVTPRIRAAQGITIFDNYQDLGMERFRATVDWPADFDRMASLFAALEDPVNEPWIPLVHELQTIESSVPKLVLGGAQLGMRYGIANATDYSRSHAVEMITNALSKGVRTIDTARAYGESEEVIGLALAQRERGYPFIVTKLDPLPDLAVDAGRDAIEQAVRRSLDQSRQAMRVDSLPLVCLHRAEHLTSHGGTIWSELIESQRQNLVGRLGVSVQAPDELELALGTPGVSHVQLPYNLLDHRWDALIDEVRQHRKERGLTIHVRSALLQGLLASEDAGLWARAHVADPEAVIQWLHKTAAEHGFSGPSELAFAFVIAQDWIDGVVTGCDNAEQLDANVALFHKLAGTREKVGWALASRPHLAERTLNPALWN